MASPHRTLVASIATTLIVSACASESPKHDAVLDALPRMLLSEQPTLTIADDDTPDHQFTRISARRLPDGDIVVADQSPARIVVFGRDGKLKKEIARQANGPREIPGFFLFETFGDTIFATSNGPMAAGAVRTFSLRDTLVTLTSPTASNHQGKLTFRSRLNATQWIVSKGAPGRALYSVPPVGTFMPDTLSLGILTLAANDGANTVVWLKPIVQSWMLVVPLVGATGLNGSPTTLPVPFALRGETFRVVSKGRLWFVDGATGELTAFDSTGREAVHTTLAIPRRPVDTEEVRRARTAALANAKNRMMQTVVSGNYDEQAMPTTLPLFSEAIAAADGEIWLKVFEVAERAPQRFVIVSREGAMRATVDLPAGNQVQEVGKDFVLVVRTDEAGVQSVLEYSLKQN